MCEKNRKIDLNFKRIFSYTYLNHKELIKNSKSDNNYY